MGWSDACDNLQPALDVAEDGDQVWVAQGTYFPGTNRSDSFELITGVAIYGGFDGSEEALTERDYEQNVTTLSGDIGTSGVDTDNRYHVVSAGTDETSVDESAELNGFTITKGYANGTNDGANGPDQGSAVNIWHESTPTLEHCVITDNYSDFHAAVNDHGGATLTNCVFSDNVSDEWAGGLYVHFDVGSDVTGCQFLGNEATEDGGGAYVRAENGGTSDAEPTFIDCLFFENESVRGGGLYCGAGRSPEITDCVFTDNCTVGNRGAGGAIYNDGSSPDIEGSMFTGNLAGSAQGGGAIYNHTNSVVDVTASSFFENSGAYPTLLYGAAIYSFGAVTNVTNCYFEDGASRYGPGVTSHGTEDDPPVAAELTVVGSQFINNTAIGAANGGAVFAERAGFVELIDCLFVGNTSGGSGGALGVVNDTKMIVTNCTFVDNSTDDDGGGIFLGTSDSGNRIDNSIFWDNADSGGGESAQIHLTSTASTAAEYCDVMDLDASAPITDNTNFDEDPVFADPSAGNYRPIRPTSGDSFIIDAGDSTQVTTTVDLDGNGRIVNDPESDSDGVPLPGGDEHDIVDIGPYEFSCAADAAECRADLNGDDEVGAPDLAQLLGAWGLSPGHPADLNCDTKVGSGDLAQLLGAWGSCP